MPYAKYKTLGKRVRGRRQGAGIQKRRVRYLDDMPDPSPYSSAMIVDPGFTRLSGYYGRFGPGGEKKFFDGIKAATNLSAAGAILEDSLNEIPEGTTQSERIGRTVTLRSIHIRGAMKIPVVAADNDAFQRIRLVLYCDKQANGATAQVLDLLETADINSYRNLAESRRFRILYDKIYLMNATTSGNGTIARAAEVGRGFNINANVNIPLEFSASTGAIAELRSDNVGLMAICDAITATAPQVNFSWRIRYSDK